MPISSTSLFHFTPKLSYLEDILRSGFWPRYCIEYGWRNKYIDFALPMVCFCDIPLTQIKEHTDFYGNFGIGVSAEWIRHNKDITPVQYISLGSQEFKLIGTLLTKLKNNTITKSEIHKLQLAKKVSGKSIRKKGKKGKNEKSLNKKFYNEREWRYVPTMDNSEQLILPVDKHSTFDIKELSKKTECQKLELHIADIRHLIIPRESYRRKLIKSIKSIYSTEASTNIDILISKITSLKQIDEDF